MIAPTGSLAITACRSGERTVLGRVRYDGISRCSRAFDERGAALVVTSQFGPGVVHGDRTVSTGHVETGAHLIVTQQAATRLMGGARSADSRATWTLGEGAVLELVGEPVIALNDARYEATTAIDLAAGSRVLISEIVRAPAGSAVRMRTSVRQFSRELLYDAIDAGSIESQVVGSFALLGINAPVIAHIAAALDAVCDGMGDVRCGVGVLPDGVFARLLGTDVWDVRVTLGALREATRRAMRCAMGLV